MKVEIGRNRCDALINIVSNVGAYGGVCVWDGLHVNLKNDQIPRVRGGS